MPAYFGSCLHGFLGDQWECDAAVDCVVRSMSVTHTSVSDAGAGGYIARQLALQSVNNCRSRLHEQGCMCAQGRGRPEPSRTAASGTTQRHAEVAVDTALLHLQWALLGT